MKKVIKAIKYFLKKDQMSEDSHLRIFLILPLIYTVSNTIISALFHQSNFLFNLSYTLIIVLLSYLAYKKILPKYILIFIFQTILFYALLVGYMISDTLLQGLIFIVVFPIVTIFLHSKRSYIVYWTLSYYLIFVLINIFHIGNNNIEYFTLFQIVFLHIFITFAISYYIYISKLKTKLLNIRQIKLQKNAQKLKMANDKMHELNLILEKLSSTDELTALNNRRNILSILQERIKLYKRKNISFLLVLIDIDHFKKVNDTYGHQEGDKVLKRVAQVQKELIREIDHIGRCGGEEFMIIIEEDKPSHAIDFLERLIRHVRTQVKFDTLITISAGASLMTPEDTQESLIHRADEALYEAKDSGRDRYVFSEK